MIPTSSYRSSTSAITSSEISRRASALASSARVRGRTANWRRQISRATSDSLRGGGSSCRRPDPVVADLAPDDPAQPPARPGELRRRRFGTLPRSASPGRSSPPRGSSRAGRGGMASHPRPDRAPRRPGMRLSAGGSSQAPVDPAPGRSGSASEVDRRQLDAARRVPGGLADAQLLQDLLLDLGGHVGVLLEELPRLLLALAELVTVVRVPGPGLPNDALLDADVDQRALTRDALAVHDVELGLLERRGDLVLHDLDPGAVTDHVGAVLQALDAADVETHGRVELQRATTGRRLGRAEHDADLLAELVDEDRGGAGRADHAGHLAQRLA